MPIQLRAYIDRSGPLASTLADNLLLTCAGSATMFTIEIADRMIEIADREVFDADLV
jgi:hypothetical protein